MLKSLLTIALAATARAATVKINVGQGGLTFTPDSVTAAKGDVLEFHFVGGNHDAVTGDFSAPCTPSTGGFASATVAGSASNVSGSTPSKIQSLPLPDMHADTNAAALPFSADPGIQGYRQLDGPHVLLLLGWSALRQRHGGCHQPGG